MVHPHFLTSGDRVNRHQFPVGYSLTYIVIFHGTRHPMQGFSPGSDYFSCLQFLYLSLRSRFPTFLCDSVRRNQVFSVGRKFSARKAGAVQHIGQCKQTALFGTQSKHPVLLGIQAHLRHTLFSRYGKILDDHLMRGRIQRQRGIFHALTIHIYLIVVNPFYLQRHFPIVCILQYKTHKVQGIACRRRQLTCLLHFCSFKQRK